MFFHLLHAQTSRLYNFDRRFSPKDIQRYLTEALRLAIFSTEETLWIPSSDLVTSEVLGRSSRLVHRLVVEEVIVPIGSTLDLDALRQHRDMQFGGTTLDAASRNNLNEADLRMFAPYLQRRGTSTTEDLV